MWLRPADARGRERYRAECGVNHANAKAPRLDVIDLCEIWLALDFPDGGAIENPRHLGNDFAEPLLDAGESSYRPPAPFMQGA